MPAKLKPLANLIAAHAKGFRKKMCIKTAADAIAAIAPNTRTCPTFAKIFGTTIEPTNIPANQPDITILVAKLLNPASGARVPSKTTCRPLPAEISSRPKKRVQVDMIALSIRVASNT